MPFTVAQFIQLLVITVSIVVATLVAGVIPVKFTNVTDTKLTYLTQFSIGVLLGTAFLIILPEGVEVLNESGYDWGAESIGYPMFLGFTMMYVLDKIFTSHGLNSQKSSSSGVSSILQSILRSSLTLGLVVHGSVDGVSLGAAYLDQSGRFHATIVVALVLHRIPTAFSLGTILTKEAVPDRHLYWHLVFFALSTPIFAWVTVTLVLMLEINVLYVTGLLLLFSAGTFLYVVNHVMQEFNDECGQLPPRSNSSEETVTTTSNHRMIPFLGLTVPILLSLIKE
ncbi:uncharacterized protein LODBEIA_P21270 [Lodderomyces beijingensis]|uniref:Zinc/iron permease n=1 Tax=Lodderomyces beijingensis TaxID=1775926 RepID=A0ABP0ZIA8_9ASCO